MKKILMLFILLAISGCSSWGGKAEYPEQIGINKYGSVDEKPQSLFGTGGISFGNVGGSKTNTGVKVNSFLWRASLDTISFMPLVSADPFGGVIITDWYTPKNVKDERFKLNIIIMSSSLQANGLKVSVFKESKNSKGEWKTAQSDNKLVGQIEKAILTRARELKVSD